VLASSGSRQEPVAGSREHDNETPSSAKVDTFWPAERLAKKDLVPWSSENQIESTLGKPRTEVSVVKIKIWIIVCGLRKINYANTVNGIVLLYLTLKVQCSAIVLVRMSCPLESSSALFSVSPSVLPPGPQAVSAVHLITPISISISHSAQRQKGR